MTLGLRDHDEACALELFYGDARPVRLFCKGVSLSHHGIIQGGMHLAGLDDEVHLLHELCDGHAAGHA